jgi:hypothetical protein
MGGGGNGKRGAVPSRGQIIPFPRDGRGGRAGGSICRLVPDQSVGAEGCADPFGGGSSPFEGDSYMTAVDAIYLSSIALVAVVIAYSCVRFWLGGE